MRLRINEIDHFLDIVEKSGVKTVYVDSHTFFELVYHIWIIDKTDMIEIRIKNLDTLLFAVTEIAKKKDMRIVKWINSRSY